MHHRSSGALLAVLHPPESSELGLRVVGEVSVLHVLGFRA